MPKRRFLLSLPWVEQVQGNGPPSPEGGLVRPRKLLRRDSTGKTPRKPLRGLLQPAALFRAGVARSRRTTSGWAQKVMNRKAAASERGRDGGRLLPASQLSGIMQPWGPSRCSGRFIPIRNICNDNETGESA